MTAKSGPGRESALDPGDGRAALESTATLYDAYGAVAYSLAYRIVRDHGTAEDVVQEAFLAVWRNRDRFDAHRGSPRGWICQIVRNGALDRLRGSSRRQREHRSLDLLVSLPSADDVIADVVDRDESRSIVAALAALPDGQRQVIELAYFGGYSQAEIATMTAHPLGTVKGRTRAALRALATSLSTLRPAAVAGLAAPSYGRGGVVTPTLAGRSG